MSSTLEVDEMAVSERGPDTDIVIAGGGLAGLALALALQHRDIEAHVFESHPYFKTDTATAIGIGPNGVTALEGIMPGLSSIVSQAGSYTNSIIVNLLRNGKEDPPRVTNMPPNEYINVRWKSVQETLASLVDSNRIVFSHKLIGYRPSKLCVSVSGFTSVNCFKGQKYLITYCIPIVFQLQGGVEAYFRYGNALDRIKVVWTRVLIGADGIWSAVRKQMVGDPPRYLNMVDWNALLYNPDLKVYHGIRRGEVIVRSEENMQVHSIIADAGDYTLWILRKRDESEDLANSLVGGRGGIGIPGCKARALEQLDGLEGWDSLRKAIDLTSEESISERKIMDRLPLDKWSDADGHVLLIGDAAHAQYVGPGQGARTAFEDAHQLSLLLQLASQPSFTEESIRDAVKRFEELRIPRLKKMQQYAAYSTRLPKFESEGFQNFTMEERMKMGGEYMKWVHSYPHKQEGDPDSTYFK